MSRASMSKYSPMPIFIFFLLHATKKRKKRKKEKKEKRNETRMKRKYVPCKKDFQLFLCLMRHIINTITLFGKFHILQVYRRDFLCLFSNSVTHLSTCLHMHTLDTIFHEDTMFLILPFFLF